MKEKLWVFIVKFLLISGPLFGLWLWKGQTYYLVFLKHALTLIVIKIAGFHVRGFPFPAPIFINLIPFISLMVITRGIRLKTRITWLAGGLLILIAWHMILTEAIYIIYLKYQIDSQAYEKLSVPLFLFSETLPFLLWILFARKQVAGLFLRRKGTDY
jgi:hypothetical protein